MIRNSKINRFMAAVYSAIAASEMPVITGFGNQTQSEDDETITEHPILAEYIAKSESMDSGEFNKYHNDAWKVYNAFLRSQA